MHKKSTLFLSLLVTMMLVAQAPALGQTSQIMDWSVSKDTYAMATIYEHMTVVESTVALTANESVEVYFSYLLIEFVKCTHGCTRREEIRADVSVDGKKLYVKGIRYNIFRVPHPDHLEYSVDFEIIASKEYYAGHIIQSVNQSKTISNQLAAGDVLLEGSVKFEASLICDNLGVVTRWSDDPSKNSEVEMPCLNLNGLH